MRCVDGHGRAPVFVTFERIQMRPMIRQRIGFKKVHLHGRAIGVQGQTGIAHAGTPARLPEVPVYPTNLPLPVKMRQMMMIGPARGQRAVGGKSSVTVAAHTSFARDGTQT